MIVPEFWAEARKRHRDGKRQITVRRFGWSDESELAAFEMAEARASEALTRILAGEELDRRERKTAYNGAFGVPIREEVLSRHGAEVITRNSYGAHCLNTPRALFADIDFEPLSSAKDIFIVFGVLMSCCVFIGLHLHRWSLAFALFFFSLFFSSSVAAIIRRVANALRGGPNRIARRHILAFVANHLAWNVRLYQTPGGLRL